MSEKFFTADEHFDHAKILEYCKRPFLSVEEMNEVQIQNHNAIVKPKDEVYHLGDFTFKDPNKFLTRLNGVHYLVKGNHDPGRVYNSNFVWVKDCYELKLGNTSIFMSHYAHRVWNKSHYGAYHLYGHTHNTLEPYGKSCDVGVDAWDFHPVTFDEIVEKLR